MPNKAGINFTTGTTSNGNNANVGANTYHGHRGVTMNPQTSASAKASSASKMSSFESAARNTAAGYNGVMHNPQTSSAAKASAASKLSNMPKW
ncbi:hypothetical protein MNV49_006862 [Pseudohyphozyma bogoriensis]|nr:hypothetical protein MNV49_003500 [Pseudohyphozyma bogoriensis]KAI5477134.1 hypothetical protein MNV49_006862 [Pseudohyphozyma bogoriensis]